MDEEQQKSYTSKEQTVPHWTPIGKYFEPISLASTWPFVSTAVRSKGRVPPNRGPTSRPSARQLEPLQETELQRFSKTKLEGILK